MKVRAITKYVFKGKEFGSLNDIKEDIHNTIGLEVLDKINRTCPLAKHKDYHKLLDLLCSKEVRKVLLESLNVKFDRVVEADYLQDNIETINVLDI